MQVGECRFSIDVYETSYKLPTTLELRALVICPVRFESEFWEKSKAFAVSLGATLISVADILKYDEWFPRNYATQFSEANCKLASKFGFAVPGPLYIINYEPDVRLDNTLVKWFSLAHDTAFATSFAAASRQARYLDLLCNRKSRSKFTSLLYHNLELSMQYTTLIDKNEQSAEDIYKLLLRHGAGSMGYCISGNSEIDGNFLPALEALQKLVGSEAGTVLSLIPGKLCYYESEERNGRYILTRG